MLTALGFGPDTVLMNDPKLFVDGRFLASLLVELQDELGARDAALALFQIGLLHGLRDAARVCSGHPGDDACGRGEDALLDVFETPDTTSLVMRWSRVASPADADAPLTIGEWPERHEAVARCSRLGPAEKPACWMSAGYTSGWLSGTLDRSLVAWEVSCAARGDEACRFEVRETAAWLAQGSGAAHGLLSRVPFEAFRRVARAPVADRLVSSGDGLLPSGDPLAAALGVPPSATPLDPVSGVQTAPVGPGDGHFDRSQPVIHIWGPVMVLPFTTLDEALGTVEMLGRDPGIGEIGAVVVDLRERPLDEGFGAAALEQILETIESWNAQSLITGVSPASEAAMASLEASHLVVRKDLPEAIATAFQIADAQRHQL